ncbi:MAG: thermostable hemolysin [Wenzhouxiangellaceae bacterium]|nr:thermostable hemolysin [Wenzhouxiangellaceae bacterium]
MYVAAFAEAEPVPQQARRRIDPKRSPFIAGFGSASWQRSAALVRQQYQLKFDAHIEPDYPRYLGLRNADHAPLAVIGVRSSAEQTLFCQRYLQTDLFERLAACSGVDVQPGQVVELGNLALTRRRLLRPLFGHAHRWTRMRPFRWLVFCATREVRLALAGTGAQLIELGPARPESIGTDLPQWGRYFTHDPIVMAARTDQSAVARAPIHRVG